mgnify:CR=1 FL=1
MKSKHLSYDDRLTIEKGLKEGCNFREIASRTGKSLSTVSREIKLHRYPKERNMFNNPNICRHRRDCNKAERCNGKECNINRCAKLTVCNSHCDYFEEIICMKLQSSSCG